MHKSTDILLRRLSFIGLVAVLCFGAASPAVAAIELVDRVVAVVEDEIITQRELDAKASPYMQNQPESRRREVYQKVLDIEIGERIVNKEIVKNQDRLGVTSKDVDRAIDEVLKINRITRDQLQAALYAQGMTWSEYRKKLREQIERARLIQFKVQGRVQVKDPDVKRRCVDRTGAKEMRVCASHILLKAEPNMSLEDLESLLARASKIQAELSSGADFSAYALKYSADTSAPDGDVGCFGRGEMVDAFEKAAFATPTGQVSAVVKTEFGFHIIKVYDRRAPSTGRCESNEELEPFRNELFQEEMERQMDAWVDELRKKAFVEVRL